jgi:colicin import membrane protein
VFSDKQLSFIEGNPIAEVEVTIASDGNIIAIKILNSSGYLEWDSAVVKALERTGKLPPNPYADISNVIFQFKPRD